MSRGPGALSRLLLSIAFAGATFQVERVQGLLWLGAIAALATWVGRVPPSRLLRTLLPVLPFAALAALHALLAGSTPAGAVGRSGGPVGDGPLQAVLVSGRLLVLVAGAGWASLTTPAPRLLEAWELLLRPAGRMGLPARDLVWTATLALRFLPILREETLRVVLAQEARGAWMHRNGGRARTRALLAVVVPTATRALRRAEELGMALDARGFRAARAPHPHGRLWQPSDLLSLIPGLALLLWIARHY